MLTQNKIPQNNARNLCKGFDNLFGTEKRTIKQASNRFVL
jgi:hypothetical protein